MGSLLWAQNRREDVDELVLAGVFSPPDLGGWRGASTTGRTCFLSAKVGVGCDSGGWPDLPFFRPCFAVSVRRVHAHDPKTGFAHTVQVL